MPNTWTDPYSNVGATTTPYKTQKTTNPSEQVLGLYQQNYGRSATSDEIAQQLGQTAGYSGTTLSPEQLAAMNTRLQQGSEYSAYQGARPNVATGDYIPGVTLGTTLKDDPYFKTLPNAPAEQETSNYGMQDAVRQQILGLLDPNKPAPSLADPANAAAMSAYSAGQNKATARQIHQNAEAFGAAGLESSGARLGADRAIIQEQGLNESTFGSNLVLQQMEQQRNQTMQALQLAMAQGDQDVSRRLQMQLAQLNAAVQREGLAQQGKLGQADIDLRQKLGMGGLNLNLLGLMQQGQQFNDSLGWDISKYEAALNNQALVNLLYGG